MRRVGGLAAALLLAACASGPRPVALEPGVAPFYTKQVTARGISIRSSDQVSDEALYAARDMVEAMFAYRPELARWLAANDYRIAIMGFEEALLDLPENADWTKPARDDPRLTRCELKHYGARIGNLTTRQYWDNRARAIGGKRMADGAEDVLGLPVSRYYGETIFVHELGHLALDAVQAIDPALYARVEAAYANALATGLWKDEYTVTTIHEYWAEGTQFWFNSNRLQVFNGQRILNHGDLAAYDPMLAAVLDAAYGDRHRLKGDPFWMSDLRIPPGPIPENTAEVC